jgi:hypothetical protein
MEHIVMDMVTMIHDMYVLHGWNTTTCHDMATMMAALRQRHYSDDGK